MDKEQINMENVKTLLNTPENRRINMLITNVTKRIILSGDQMSEEELKWFEDYLSCVINVKKILDIPKQLNIFIYKDQLPDIRNRFVELRDTAPPKYRSEIVKLKIIMESGINLVIKDDTKKQKISGYHLSNFR